MEKNTQLLPGKAGIKPVITEIIRNAGEILKLELGLLESAFHEIEIIFSTVTIFHISTLLLTSSNKVSNLLNTEGKHVEVKKVIHRPLSTNC